MKLSFLVQLILLLILVVSVYLVFTNSVEGKTKMILIVLSLVIGIYLLSKMSVFKDYDEVVSAPTDAKEAQSVTNLKKTDGNFAISCWIFIDDWNYKYGQEKIILEKTVTNGSSLPKISLDPYKNDLKIRLNAAAEDGPEYKTAVENAFIGAGDPGSYDATLTYDCSGEFLRATDPSAPETPTIYNGAGGNVAIPCVLGNAKEIKVENINMQKWVNILTTVNNRTLDVYINGKLVQTQEFNNVIDVNQLNYGGINVTPNGGFGGFVSKVQYYPYFVTPRKAWNIYKGGFGDAFESGMDKYNMSVSFYEDSVEKKKYYIF